MADEPSIDSIHSRNATKVFIEVAGARVGRVQQMSRSQANNVQVLTELGRDVAVELKKGITIYSFSIARFLIRSDHFRNLAKNGNPFSLTIKDAAGADGNGATEILDYFKNCMIQSIDESYTSGAATVAQNVSVVTIGSPTDTDVAAA